MPRGKFRSLSAVKAAAKKDAAIIKKALSNKAVNASIKEKLGGTKADWSCGFTSDPNKIGSQINPVSR